MPSILMEALKPQIEERDRINLIKYVLKGYMSITDAAREAGMSVENFRQQMERYKKDYKTE